MTDKTKAGNKPENLQEELEIYRVLKPYIAQCLTLNHDLNNPLAGIIGYGEFLLEESEGLTDEQCGFVKHILTCATRIEKLITELSDHKIELSEKVDLNILTEMYPEPVKTSN